MSNKSWHIERRSFLHGLGVALTLPYLEAMGESVKATKQSAAPKRMCFMYFPNGCGIPNEQKLAEEHKKWSWFPNGEGQDYDFTNTLSVLKDHRDDITILGGLSHPRSRELMGHMAGDSWLTGGNISGANYRNNISVDQVAAKQFGKHTRFPSLTLSVDGGVGYQSRVSTLSFDDGGKPMPAEHRHREIFERYFSPNGGSTTKERRAQISRGKKIVDLVLEDSKRLRRELGKRDQQKLEEYLDSLSSVEQQIRRNEAWLDTPMKPFKSDHIEFEVDAKKNPETYIRSMIDIMVLGFQTDITRVMTYMLAREDGMGFGDHFPKLACDIKSGHHGLSHSKQWENWSKYDRWLASHYAYLIDRMKTVEDEHGNLLDNTLMLFGSACSTTHNARNCPLVLAGGKKLGMNHGSYSIYDEHTPLTNLYVSMLNTVGLKRTRYSDSTGRLPGEIFPAAPAT
jgi:hypothetical protein